MGIITLKRVIRAGYLSFRRNGWLSAATVMVITLALVVVGILVFLGAVAGTVLEALETKIDISVYFKPDSGEESIFSVKKELELLPNVAEVRYVSKDQALEDFRERHKANALVIGALEELGDNPLEASLNIRAEDPLNYAAISDFLLKKNYPSVDKINYFENEKVIQRLSSIISSVRGGGAVLALFLAFIAVLVAFNTVRLAIYTMREEIGIMRLVGATQWFIRGPFLVSGVIYGFLAAVVTTLFFFPLSWVASPRIATLVPGFDLFQYFVSNSWELTGMMLAIGICLGVVSSFIAIRRYLKI